MKVVLNVRENGVHSPLKEIEVEGSSDIYLIRDSFGNYMVNEELLLHHLPEGFLLSHPSKILLLVTNKGIGTGIRNPDFFHCWEKCYGTFSLELFDEREYNQKPETFLRDNTGHNDI